MVGGRVLIVDLSLLFHAFAALPAGLEEGDVVALVVGVLRALLQVQVDAQAGPLRKAEVAVHHVGRIIDDLRFPVDVELVEDLLEEEVRGAGGEL